MGSVILSLTLCGRNHVRPCVRHNNCHVHLSVRYGPDQTGHMRLQIEGLTLVHHRARWRDELRKVFVSLGRRQHFDAFENGTETMTLACICKCFDV